MSNLTKPSDVLPLRVTFKRYQSDVVPMTGGRLRLCAALMLLVSIVTVPVPVAAEAADVMPLEVAATHNSTTELTTWVSKPYRGRINFPVRLRPPSKKNSME